MKTTEVAIKNTPASANREARTLNASAFPGQTYTVQPLDARRFMVVLTDTDTAAFRN